MNGKGEPMIIKAEELKIVYEKEADGRVRPVYFIDAEPVRHGQWKYVKKRLARGGYVDASECSVCHKRIMPHLKPNYCPNCGAKMEEERRSDAD